MGNMGNMSNMGDMGMNGMLSYNPNITGGMRDNRPPEINFALDGSDTRNMGQSPNNMGGMGMGMGFAMGGPMGNSLSQITPNLQTNPIIVLNFTIVSQLHYLHSL